MRVLYVDDNAVNRRVIREMLRPIGVEMSEAADGEAGLQMIADNDYDLILMDLRMPGMDGTTAIRRVRARDDAKAALPIIVVTADSGSNVRPECLAAGADDLILKPISMTLLYDVIGCVMARRSEGAVRRA